MARHIRTETVSVKSNSLAKNTKKTKHSVETKERSFSFQVFSFIEADALQGSKGT